MKAWHNSAACHKTIECRVIQSKLRAVGWFIVHMPLEYVPRTVVHEQEFEESVIPQRLRCVFCWGPREKSLDEIKENVRWQLSRLMG